MWLATGALTEKSLCGTWLQQGLLFFPVHLHPYSDGSAGLEANFQGESPKRKAKATLKKKNRSQVHGTMAMLLMFT